MKVIRYMIYSIMLLGWIAWGAVGWVNLARTPELPGKFQESPRGVFFVFPDSSQKASVKIVALDEHPIHTLTELTEVLHRFHAGQAVHLMTSRQKSIPLILASRYSTGFMIFRAAGGILFLLMAILLFSASKQDGTHHLGWIGLWLGFVFAVGIPGAHLTFPISLVLAATVFTCVFQSLGGYLYAGYTFPSTSLQHPQLTLRKTAFRYAGITLALGFFIIYLTRNLQPTPAVTHLYELSLESLPYLMTIIIAFSLWKMVGNSAGTSNPVSHSKLLWVLAGWTWVCLFGLVLYVLPPLLGVPTPFPGWSAMLGLLIPYGAHAIAEYRCRRWQAETNLLRLISYGGALLLIAILFAGTQKLTALLSGRLSLTDVVFINIAEVFLSALLFAPLLRLLHGKAARHLYPVYHHRQTALALFSEELQSCLTLTELADATMRHFRRNVAVEQQCIFKKEDDRIIVLSGNDAPPMELDFRELFDKPMTMINSVELKRTEPGIPLPGRYFSLPYVIIQPIGNELRWLVGAPPAGSIFYREDLQFARDMAAEAEKHILKLNALYRKMEGEWQSEGENLHFGE